MYSTNRQGYRYKVRKACEWEKEASYLLLRFLKFGDKKISLTIHYFFKNDRSDLGNRTKILQDLLEKMHIIENDKQVWEVHEYKAIDKKNFRVEILVKEID